MVRRFLAGRPREILAAEFAVSTGTVSKWVARYRAEGEPGLVDRSSAPGVVANRTKEDTVQAIAALRRLRFTGAEISELLDRPLSTVSGILTRIGMGKLGRLGMEPANRVLDAVEDPEPDDHVEALSGVHERKRVAADILARASPRSRRSHGSPRRLRELDPPACLDPGDVLLVVDRHDSRRAAMLGQEGVEPVERPDVEHALTGERGGEERHP